MSSDFFCRGAHLEFNLINNSMNDLLIRLNLLSISYRKCNLSHCLVVILTVLFFFSERLIQYVYLPFRQSKLIFRG